MSPNELDRHGLDARRMVEIPDPFVDDARVAPQALRRPLAAASPTRSRVRALRWGAFAAALLCNAAWLLFERRPDLGSAPPWRLVLGMAIPLAAGALALGAAVRHGPRGLGEDPLRLGALTLSAPALFVVGTWLAATQDGSGSPFWRRAAGCTAVTAVLTAGPVLFGALAFRRAFVAAPAWRTAALGMACGALAAATMSIVCSIGDAWHVVVAHGSMMFVLGVCGAWLGRRFALA